MTRRRGLSQRRGDWGAGTESIQGYRVSGMDSSQAIQLVLSKASRSVSAEETATHTKLLQRTSETRSLSTAVAIVIDRPSRGL